MDARETAVCRCNVGSLNIIIGYTCRSSRGQQLGQGFNSPRLQFFIENRGRFEGRDELSRDASEALPAKVNGAMTLTIAPAFNIARDLVQPFGYAVLPAVWEWQRTKDRPETADSGDDLGGQDHLAPRKAIYQRAPNRGAYNCTGEDRANHDLPYGVRKRRLSVMSRIAPKMTPVS